MKKVLFPIFLMAVVLLLNGCSTAKKVAYFQNIDTLNLAPSVGLYDARIMPKDELTITVVTSDPEAVDLSTFLYRARLVKVEN